MTETDFNERLKTGRNDDCLCGSKKKYKKCHLAADEAAQTAALAKINAEAAAHMKEAEKEGDDHSKHGHPPGQHGHQKGGGAPAMRPQNTMPGNRQVSAPPQIGLRMNYFDPKLYFTTEGRVNRRPYFFAGLVAAAFVKAGELVPDQYAIFYLPVSLIFLFATFSLGIRRCHDRDRTGWFMLLLFVPLLNLWPLVELTFFKGTTGPNQYGPDPLQSSDAQVGQPQDAVPK